MRLVFLCIPLQIVRAMGKADAGSASVVLSWGRPEPYEAKLWERTLLSKSIQKLAKRKQQPEKLKQRRLFVNPETPSLATMPVVPEWMKLAIRVADGEVPDELLRTFKFHDSALKKLP